jgi:hypothetical protein
MTVFLLNQPESWDDDDDGTWKPRMIPNPEYKGPWKRKVYLLYTSYNFLTFCSFEYLCTHDFSLSEN